MMYSFRWNQAIPDVGTLVMGFLTTSSYAASSTRISPGSAILQKIVRKHRARHPFGSWTTLFSQRSIRSGGGGGGGGAGQKFVYQKWPDKISSVVNSVFSHDGHFGLGGPWGGHPPSSCGVRPF